MMKLLSLCNVFKETAMAELILTQEEKDTSTYLEWSNEALGKAVKKLALDLSIGDDALTAQSMLLLLINVLNSYGATKAKLKLEGVTYKDSSIGNWKCTIEKITEESDGQGNQED